MLKFSRPRSATAKKTGRSRRGTSVAAYSLFEVMMSVFVMAAAIVTSITTLQQGMRALDTARNLTLANQIMQSEIEIIRMQNWSQIIALPASATVDSSSTITTGTSTTLDAALTAFANDFTVTRTVADIAGRSNIKQITLTGVWFGVDGRRHSQTYQTRYAKDGLADYYYVSH